MLGMVRGPELSARASCEGKGMPLAVGEHRRERGRLLQLRL